MVELCSNYLLMGRTESVPDIINMAGFILKETALKYLNISRYPSRLFLQKPEIKYNYYRTIIYFRNLRQKLIRK